jgi:hypothetical protein
VWLPAPDPSEPLRQGDLLLDVPFVALVGEPVADDQGLAKVRVRNRPAVVISQCCTIENGDSVEVAQISNTAPLRPEQPFFQGLMNTDWPPVASRSTVSAAFPIGPVDGHLKPKSDGRVLTVDFTRTTNFLGDLAWLQAKRVARMSPEARRLLRLRLALHWSREEPEDGRILRDLGIDPAF